MLIVYIGLLLAMNEIVVAVGVDPSIEIWSFSTHFRLSPSAGPQLMSWTKPTAWPANVVVVVCAKWYVDEPSLKLTKAFKNQ